MNAVTRQPLHRSLGLTDGEYERIGELLEREPNDFELAVFSLLWSEHCAYKHSRALLAGLPTSGERVLQGPGENAGVIDVGDGIAVALKVESHNHPSAVEPFQGAATGVGGILRDIIAMGARPIAILDSLRFGELDSERQRHLFARVVEGVGHYGNCVGVANVGGEVEFEPAYEHNCLVNAMCVGVLPADRLQKAGAAGAGNLLVLYGSKTGRDGIGGASVLASQGFEEGSEAKRPSVQIGDPFTGKKLIECTLELLDAGVLVSLQDLGAAGLASSTSEMASAGGVGLDVDLSAVPVREEGMEPFEIMISESQERMAAIVEPAAWPQVEAICRRWDIDATVIGEVTLTGDLRAFHGGELVGDIPAAILTDEAPRYVVERARPARLADDPLPPSEDPALNPSAALRALLESRRRREPLLGHPAVRPARRVGHGRAARRRCGGGAADSVAARDRHLARRQRPPHLARPAPRRHERRVRGGPERRLHRRPPGGCHQLPELRQPRARRDRLRARGGDRGHGRRLPRARPAGRLGQRLALQRARRPADPADARGRRRRRPRGRRTGGADRLPRRAATWCCSPARATAAIDGSDYQKVILGEVAGRIPEPDLELERALHEFLAAAADRGLLRSAHDVGGGGLAVAVAAVGDRRRDRRARRGSGRPVRRGRRPRGGVGPARRRGRASHPRDRHPAAPPRRRSAAPRSRSARPGSRLAMRLETFERALPRIMDGGA